MARSSDPDLQRAIEVVEAAQRRATRPKLVETRPSRVEFEALLEASRTLLHAAQTPSPIGQRKEADPFAPIYVVFDSDGHRFECTHEPPHSSPL